MTAVDIQPLTPGEQLALFLHPRSFDGERIVGLSTRPSDDNGLSCDRMTLHAADAQQAKKVLWRRCRLPRRHKKGRFFIFDADELVAASERNTAVETLKIVPDPKPADENFEANPAHALIVPILAEPDPLDLYVSVFNAARRGHFPAFNPNPPSTAV